MERGSNGLDGFAYRWFVANVIAFGVAFLLYTPIAHGITGGHGLTLSVAQRIAHSLALAVAALLVAEAQLRVLQKALGLSRSRMVIVALTTIVTFWLGSYLSSLTFFDLDIVLGFTALGSSTWLGAFRVPKGKGKFVVLSVLAFTLASFCGDAAAYFLLVGLDIVQACRPTHGSIVSSGSPWPWWRVALVERSAAFTYNAHCPEVSRLFEPRGLVATVDQLLFVLTLLAALGCGLIAGVFFAFSAFVMKAFARLPAGEGNAAMQSINVVVLKSWFMVAFLGTAAACVLTLISALLQWHEPGAIYRFAGGVLYLVGTFLVTIVFNVPKNEALASVAPTDPGGASLWAGYVLRWTAWNHVRTVAALAAAASFSIALGS